MRIETINRNGREFAVIPAEALRKLMEDAEMLADVKAYDAAKARLEVWRRRTHSLWRSPSAACEENPRFASGASTASSRRSN